jgi:glucose 1-dehydrogenase
MGTYSASKAAVVMLIKQMALEWAADGIRCNSVSPGATVTGMTAKTLGDPERRAQRGSQIPLGRVGMPEDLARTIYFLLSPEASFITGVDIAVDGGLGVSLMKNNAGSSLK